jgi:hypothetical protein
MKRDMDLIRQILLAVEQDDDATGRHEVSVNIEGHLPIKVEYHVRLAAEDGLLIAMDAGVESQIAVLPTRLTPAGHDFLEASRDITIWQRAKILAVKTGGESVAVLMGIMIEIGKERLKKLLTGEGS